MKQEYVNAFLAPAKLVWEKELRHPLNLARAEAVSHSYTTDDITAIVGVVGSLQGNVLFGFDNATALSVAGRMMGEPVNQMDEIGLSALGEIANMVTGNAATHLSVAGYECDISTPVIIESPGTKITTPASSQILVTFTSDLGSLSIRISLSETPK